MVGVAIANRKVDRHSKKAEGQANPEEPDPGAGKSTTQKILYRILTEYSGSVRIAGTEIRDWSPAVYSLMGIGFETPNLYTRLTGRENLEFALAIRHSAHRQKPGEVTGKTAAAVPSRTSLTIDEAARRLGVEDAIDVRVETYLKGMRMRLAFIRAILHGPALLFLDEPTSGLDPLWARRVKDWILEIRDTGAVVFLTTHSMELADELCDTVGFLVDGRLVAEDGPAALKQRYGRSGFMVAGISPDGLCRRGRREIAGLRRYRLASLLDRGVGSVTSRALRGLRRDDSLLLRTPCTGSSGVPAGDL